MWRDRLIRLLIVVFVTFLVLGLIKTQAQQGSQSGGFQLPIKEKVEELGEKVLGAVVKKLPKAPDLEKVGQADQKVEPIEEPVQNVQNLINELVESVKKLPQDQIEAIKKQIYKKLSEELVRE